MFERIFRRLLHLYPARFREEYGDEALQLFRDRTRDEAGLWRSLRLWFDLLTDLVISLPREYCHARRGVIAAPARTCSEGAPTFFMFDTASPGRHALLFGGLLSLIVIVSLPWLINGGNNLRPSGGWRFASAGAYERRSADARPPISESEGVVSQSPPRDNPMLDATFRRRIIGRTIASLKQHHLDPSEARKAADALLAHEQQGDDNSAKSATEFTRLVTKQMREATGDHELELLFSPRGLPERPPGPAPVVPAGYRDQMQRINCAFERVELLPHNVGYIKLNAFPDTSVCQATATAAMERLNNADAIIFDLRDNRGGFPSMVALIAAHLFDHPEYMYCPLENTTAESWTRSPVPGNKLSNKPVYILTSSRTISAAEEFTYNLKMLKRATLVGETTAGGAHAANLHSIGDNFYVATVEVRAINPYSKYDWNETGIEPDFKTSAPDALKVALRLAGKRLHLKQAEGTAGRP